MKINILNDDINLNGIKPCACGEFLFQVTMSTINWVIEGTNDRDVEILSICHDQSMIGVPRDNRISKTFSDTLHALTKPCRIKGPLPYLYGKSLSLEKNERACAFYRAPNNSCLSMDGVQIIYFIIVRGHWCYWPLVTDPQKNNMTIYLSDNSFLWECWSYRQIRTEVVFFEWLGWSQIANYSLTTLRVMHTIRIVRGTRIETEKYSFHKYQ